MICLTFDTDHMSEDHMAEFFRSIEIPGHATFFAHQKFGCFGDTNHEVCPHPFIDDLGAWENTVDVLQGSLGICSRGVRPHSCVFSHMIGIGLHQKGYTWVSQQTALYEANPRVFRHPWGVYELPIYYMDNMDFWAMENWPAGEHEVFSEKHIEQAISGDGVYVFDFHPIHIALNTSCASDYAKKKALVTQEGMSPFALAGERSGVRDYFELLCDRMVHAGVHSVTCSGVLEQVVMRAVR